MNKLQLLATITKDIELKYAQSGTCIASFSVAYNSKYKDQSGQYIEKASFFDVTAFGKTAENLQKFFHRGSRILIDGELDYQSWEKDGQKRSKIGIKLHSFDFIDRKSDTQHQDAPQPSQNAHAHAGTANQQAESGTPIPEIDIDTDQIPF